jgi:hypothetical protein
VWYEARQQRWVQRMQKPIEEEENGEKEEEEEVVVDVWMVICQFELVLRHHQ